jgi:hypothetical protein
MDLEGRLRYQGLPNALRSVYLVKLYFMAFHGMQISSFSASAFDILRKEADLPNIVKGNSKHYKSLIVSCLQISGSESLR